MELVFITHRRRAALQVAHVAAFVGDDEGAFELAGIRRVDAEIGRQLHRAADAFGHVAERAIAEDGGIQRREEVVGVRHHRTQVFLHQVWMFLHRLGEGAENDALFGQVLLERRGDRHAVHDRIDGYASQALLFVERDAELLECLQQLGVDFVQTAQLLALLGRGVVDDGLVVNGRILGELPRRLLHREPVPISFEPPIEHELGLVLLARNEADDLLIQPRRDGLRLDVRGEAVLVFRADEFLDGIGCGAHRVSSLNR